MLRFDGVTFGVTSIILVKRQVYRGYLFPYKNVDISRVFVNDKSVSLSPTPIISSKKSPSMWGFLLSIGMYGFTLGSLYYFFKSNRR